jgi:hypothetical protein
MRAVNNTHRISTNDPDLIGVLRAHATLINLLAQGRAVASLCLSASPTSGLYAQGDLVRNSAPTEQGSVGSKFVVLGWLCVAGGEPGTLVPIRALTGN